MQKLGNSEYLIVRIHTESAYTEFQYKMYPNDNSYELLNPCTNIRFNIAMRLGYRNKVSIFYQDYPTYVR